MKSPVIRYAPYGLRIEVSPGTNYDLGTVARKEAKPYYGIAMVNFKVTFLPENVISRNTLRSLRATD